MNDRTERIAVIGAGLVGCVNTCFLARRGFHVDVYESRSDIRLEKRVPGKSINLALSHRGRSALRAIGVEGEVVKHGIPCYSRMIHNPDGSTRAIPYGQKDQYIMAMDRRLLNEILMNEMEKYSNVVVYYKHKLIDVDVRKGQITALSKDTNTKITKTYDLIVGNDGAYSSIRKALMRNTLFNYKQEYISHDYLEIVFPPKGNGEYTMPINHLHIWPRNEFMLMALPNMGGSFTGTIFMPRVNFESLNSDERVLQFFRKNFPDALNLLGEKTVTQWFASQKASNLIAIKCSPYHVEDRCVIMGDAAHAMVPFYGQGMNSGFEDALIFDELMEKFNCQFDLVLPEFTRIRTVDAHAICDLSMRNYIEMRQSVNSKLFLLRKKIDGFLHWMFPKRWIPLYTMVAFTRTPYSKCIEDRSWQDKVINRSLATISIALLTGLTVVSYQQRKTIENTCRSIVERIVTWKK